VGWFLLAIAAIAGAVYLITKNWEAIKEFFSNIWARIKGYFSNGIAGIARALLDFNPIILLARAFDALFEWLFGFSLLDAGKNIINSLWDGLKSIWENIKKWFKDAIDSLTSWMPERLKSWLGLEVKGQPGEPGQPGGNGQTGVPGQPGQSGQPAQNFYPMDGYGFYPAPSGPPAGAAPAMNQAAQNRSQAQDVDVTTRVVIEGKNLPQGMEVSAPRSQADRTDLNLGYQAAFP
jgi:hypothetical protein